jgi:exodeoxyribonuclease VIII
MKNQIIPNLTFAEYQDIDAVNFSSLKHIARSPAYYKFKKDNPTQPTASMEIGKAVHSAVLEPHKFTGEYTSYDGRRAGGDWQEFQANNPDKTILKTADYDRVMQMLNAVKRHDLARGIFEKGTAELSVVWTDPNTGILCKCRIDWVNDFITDLKTTQDPTLYPFCRDAAKFHYFTQVAFYRFGYYVVTGDRLPVQVVAVSNGSPHEVVVYDAHGDILNHGTVEFTAMLERLKECQQSDTWEEYCQGDKVPMLVPGWCVPFGQDDNDSDPFAGL